MLGQTVHYPPIVPCSTCGLVIENNSERTQNYLLGGSLTCSKCGSALDWWALLSNYIKNNFLFTSALVAVGAHFSSFSIEMEPEILFKLRFVEFGVPQDARILSVIYTPYNTEGNCLIPLEVHSNLPRLSHTAIGNEIALFPRPLNNKLPAVKTSVMVGVHWILPTNDVAWENVIKSFEAYIDRDWKSTILPANVAVEASAFPVVETILLRSASRSHVSAFLKSDASYGHQLNVLIPLMCSAFNLCKLPPHIRVLLQKLKKIRDKLAHTGDIQPAPSLEEVGELLAAAVVAVQYFELLKRQFEEHPANPQQLSET